MVLDALLLKLPSLKVRVYYGRKLQVILKPVESYLNEGLSFIAVVVVLLILIMCGLPLPFTVTLVIKVLNC